MSRDPLGDAAFLFFYSDGKSRQLQYALHMASLKPSYLFVSNDPVQRVDLLGLATINRRRDGTFAVGVEACEIVRVIDDGIQNRLAYRFDFAFEKQGPSAAGFIGCYADDINNAIKGGHLVPGSPKGPPWNDVVDRLHNNPDWVSAVENSAQGAQSLAADWLKCKTCTSVKITKIGLDGKISGSRTFTTTDVGKVSEWMTESK